MLTPRRLTNLAFAAAIALFAVIGIASTRAVQGFIRAHQEAERLEGAIDALAHVTEVVTAAESRVRAFLVTDDPRFGVQYLATISGLPEAESRLSAAVAGDSVGERTVAELLPLLARRARLLQASFEVGSRAAGTAARSLVIERGATLTDSILALRQAYLAIQQPRLEAALETSAALSRRAPTFARAASLLGLLLVLAAFVMVNRGVRSRARAQAALQETQERARVVLNTVSDGIISVDEHGIIHTLNPAAERLFGWTEAELIGRNVATLMPRTVSAAHDGYIARYLREGAARMVGRTVEVTGLRRDGSLFPVELSINEVRLNERRLFTGVLRDVSERRRLEDQLRRTLTFRQAILDSADNSIISTDPDGVIRTFNATAELWLGHTADEMIGKATPAAFHDREEVERRAEELSSAFATRIEPGFDVFVEEARRGLRSQREWTYVRKDGSRFPVLLSVAALRDADGAIAGFLGIATDLTGRKAAEDARQRSEARYRSVVEVLGEGIFIQDASGMIVEANAAAARILGCSRDDVVGRPVGETPWQTTDEAFQPVPPEERPAGVALRTGAPIRNTVLGAVRPDGVHVWLLVNVQPMGFGPDGRATAVVTSFIDITRRKDAEAAAELSRREAVRANRAKSDFLANMSHELRTPLNSVIGFASILHKNRDGTFAEQDLDFLDRIVANGKHLLALINSILDLSKIEAGKVELELADVALDALVAETLALVGGVVQGDARRLGEVVVEGAVPPGLRPVRTDAGKLKQVLVNLVGNALRFTERGSVRILVIADPATGDADRIEVRDTGIGIPTARQAAVFEAFQQADCGTARKYGGTGLGLTISRSLLHLMGYRISLESEEGRGSTFTVHLRQPTTQPLAAAKPGPRRTPLPSEIEFRGRTVLVIDDEADSRYLLRRMIEEHGARVVEAPSGPEGLAAARADRPDLITVDLLMPDLSGWEVVRALRADPALREIPALVVSILADERSAADLPVDDRLTKPVHRDELLAALRKHLTPPEAEAP